MRNKEINAMERPRCETCPFWERNETLTCFGDCHRHPPQVVTLDNEWWPCTSGSDWCGEHPDVTKWLSEKQRDDA